MAASGPMLSREGCAKHVRDSRLLLSADSRRDRAGPSGQQLHIQDNYLDVSTWVCAVCGCVEDRVLGVRPAAVDGVEELQEKPGPRRLIAVEARMNAAV